MKHPLVAAACLGLALQATGAPRQSDVTPPGGFAAACGASVAGTNVMAYGGFLADSWSSPSYAGQHACDGSLWGAPASQGAASTTFSAPRITNAAQSQAGLGWVQLSASNASPANTFFAQGAANGGWSDSSTVTVAGLSGAAIWLFDVQIEGLLHTVGGSANFGATAYKNEVELQRSVAGFSAGSSDSFTTDRQRVRWSATAGNNTEERSRQVATVVTFAVPVTLGSAFVWGAYASAVAGQRAATTGDGRIVAAEVASPFTMRYLGSQGVLAGGQLYADHQIVSDSGIDWVQATAVPEPGPAALLAAGLAVLAGVAHRRRG